MGHAITIRDLLLCLCLLGGVGGVGFGILATFAGGMSDNPSAGDAAGREGCIALVAGLIVIVACVWGLAR